MTSPVRAAALALFATVAVACNRDGLPGTNRDLAIGTSAADGSSIGVFDLEGRPDLLAVAPKTVSFQTATFTVGRFAHSLAIGDLDGDGRLDLVAANLYGRIDTMTTRIVRDRALRRTLLDLYGHACALCRMRLRWDRHSAAEAAHIKPRSLLGADDVRNALALCGAHHWAFDLGLWTATDDLLVLVREPLAGSQYDVRALAEFRDLSPPARATARPHPSALAWHRRYTFSGHGEEPTGDQH